MVVLVVVAGAVVEVGGMALVELVDDGTFRPNRSTLETLGWAAPALSLIHI